MEGGSDSGISCNFYPRSPCGERRYRDAEQVTFWQFLSTLSLRRATTSRLHKILADWDFYPRSPCGERRESRTRWEPGKLFLSTLSLRRATVSCNYFPFDIAISIHALLAESDSRPYCTGTTSTDFYPRSPCGERRRSTGTKRHFRYFYPRSPCGERRRYYWVKNWAYSISIHALLAESDRSAAPWQGGCMDFYPRSPCGERLAL